jgi:surface antigen/peptidoglycan hydrolase CwlO-like protein
MVKINKKRLSLSICAAVIAISGPLQFAQVANADKYDDQINAIRRQIDQLRSKAGELSQQANSLQAAVNALTAEKNTIQAQINLSQARYDKLTHDIAVNKKKLADSQEVLGEIIANLYVDDKISPLEMLASSQNVSEYIDRQEYRTAATERLNTLIDEVKKLKERLEKDQKEVARVLADQKNQREALAAKEAEKQQLLDKTRGEEAVYNSMMAGKNAEIQKLREQQAAEIRARASAGGGFTALPGDPNRGGYPAKWANAPMNAYVDDWGMYTRQCVSYAAYKVATTYGNMPYWGGRGNANQWANNARAVGIPTSPVPKAGTVGVQYSGYYGHVAWVESVNADGTLTISQFNANWTGDYSMWIVQPSFFNEYIYFGG